MDVQMMVLSLSSAHKSSVDILINLSVSSLNKSGAKNSLRFESNAFDNVNHHLGKFATPVGKRYLSTEWKNFIKHVGQEFDGGVIDFREKLAKYAIEHGFQYKCQKNEPSRVTAVCCNKESEGCLWNVHATLDRSNDFFYIRRLNNEHTCSSRIRDGRSPSMGSKIVSLVLANQIRTNPLIRPVEVVKDFKRNYGLDISYYNAWKGKEMAKNDVHGDDEQSYKRLGWYINELAKKNPGYYVKLECDADNRFVRMFVAFQGCIDGYKHCRPILALDGTHIKNKYKGCLLSATGKNGANGIYPFAYAIVGSEDKNNWTWFMENLYDILKDQGRTITFISDRCKGLLEAVPKVFPDSPHGYCLHHLQKNIRTMFSNSVCRSWFRERMVSLFNNCAYAPTKEQFVEELGKFKKVGGERANQFLKTLPDENWSNAYFPGKRYGEMCSNIAESFNSWIKDERELPIYQLVDGIRLKMMKLNSDRCHEADTWNTYLCPTIEKNVDTLIQAGRNWEVFRSSTYVFEVRDIYSFMVDLSCYTCSCYQWQILSFPCAHAFAAILKNDENPFDYIEDYFSVSDYKQSYSHPIVPIPDIERDEDSATDNAIRAPLTKTPPDRPKRKRILSNGENPRSIKCSRCNNSGRHNRKTCKATI
ncbi:protein FAR1-RELATED SEQUENCE 6-like [Argentina anserina]|uniref:protein FAR1-RELATED SEQUENCE 6-like n=1 Tax=Argentina anserina TaxID=57926 RepID=UPI0021764B26|nr:protein FAR1-RELATED SEQUENCE 6-like [Potentilla anserina]